MFAIAFFILLLSLAAGQSEKELLLELKHSLTYDSSVSSKLLDWSESTDFCGWAGVECDSTRRVSSLDLSEEWISDGINGADSSLFRLKHLQSLNLALNSFNSHELPSGFGQLTELRYLNLSSAGFSGEIPSDFSNLTRLVSLDLWGPISMLNIHDLHRLIHNYTRLRELNLNGVNISGSADGNEWGSAISSSLPNLRVLSMSSSSLTGPFDPSLRKLRYLSHIHLDLNNFSSPFPDFFADFPNLEVLSMGSCGLSGVVPAKLFQMRSLRIINLSDNDNLGGSLPEFPVNGSLQELVLGGPRFTGTLPESIGNLGALSELSVTGSRISGLIPSSIRNLRQLVELDLSQNRFSGPVPSFALLKNLFRIDLSGNRLTGQIVDSLWTGLDNLGFLYLHENSLEGEIPSSLFLLPSLEALILSDNSFSSFPRVLTNASSSLHALSLSRNKFVGSIPRVLFELSSLSTLSLAGNKFSGPLELSEFYKLSNLTGLYLSYYNLSVHVNEDVSLSSLFPRLGQLELVSCKLQKLPNLRNHSSLSSLDLSSNEIDGPIPNWLWEVNGGMLGFLNLSHNRFTHLQEPYNLSNLIYFDLHDNELVGQIPIPSSQVNLLDFSSNRFSSFPPLPLPSPYPNFIVTAFFSAADNEVTGPIPPSFCNSVNLEVLDLSNNGLSGGIPSCLMKDTLRVLNLRGNSLGGYIPDTFPIGCSLATLDLSRNSLQGKLPKSLTRCSGLEVLDLTSNVLDETLPCWLEALSRLRVLVLRSNMFHGNISCLGEISSWRNLHILDLASNNISGIIPAEMFRNLQGFMIDDTLQQPDVLQLSAKAVSNVYYQDSVTVTIKGLNLELKKILRIFTAIDLSSNRLQGVIPEEIGELRSIHVLNLSHNALSGVIPSSVGNLKQLESLDLSFNGLSGGIPEELASLTFLSVLNMSNNDLVGGIPRGPQLDGFTSSFGGNEGLCGFPVNKSCTRDDGLLPAFLQEESSDPGMYASAAWGFFVGLGIFVGPLLLWKRWRCYYSKLLTSTVLLLLRRRR